MEGARDAFMAFSGGNQNFNFDSSKELISLKEVPDDHCTLPSKYMEKRLMSNDKSRPVMEKAQKYEARGVQTAEDAGDVVHWRTLPCLQSSNWKTLKASHGTVYKTKWVCRLISAYKHFAITG